MPTAKCYTLTEVLAILKLSRASFYEAKANGDLTMLEELRPRIGRQVRYRADLLDRYLEGRGVITPIGRRRTG